ncbi:MAG TPA: FecR domain-containing protein [Opitutaceae bacterium]|nr:FecR domain-containing protein [Opitutaceae bacterium]
MKPESSHSDQPFSPHVNENAREIAVRWVRRRSKGLTAAEREELKAWLASDPDHAKAFAAADSDHSLLDWPLTAGETEAVLAGLEKRRRNRRVRRQTWMGVGLAALVAIGFFFKKPKDVPGHPTIAALKVIEPSKKILIDGSEVELKDGAQITTDFSDVERRVFLTNGTAHFKVTKNPQRPFIVSAGSVAVRAVGTAFSVEFEPQGVTVFVTEGRVAVASAALPAGASSSDSATSVADVDAGGGVVVAAADKSIQRLPESELANRLAWMLPRLEFSGMPLRDVAQTLNRYNRVKLVLTERSLEDLKVSGALRADKVNALVAMLESDFHLKVERSDDATIKLYPGP